MKLLPLATAFAALTLCASAQARPQPSDLSIDIMDEFSVGRARDESPESRPRVCVYTCNIEGPVNTVPGYWIVNFNDWITYPDGSGAGHFGMLYRNPNNNRNTSRATHEACSTLTEAICVNNHTYHCDIVQLNEGTGLLHPITHRCR